MSEGIIANFVLAVQQYPNLALFIVFLVAFSESLIIIGLIVPGAIFMVLFGALIALDSLQFWPTVFFAVTGAIAGDSLSYWLGRRYQYKIITLWPLSRHPEVIIRANQFFDRHGTKSIILSRFIGPLRPVIPAIAGMAKMPRKVFLTANISSAFFWAPLYLLPGILFGLSIEMASEFASKFIFLIVLLLLGILFLLWAVQRFYLLIKPYNDKLISKFLSWGEKHPIAGQVPAAIFDETHPEVRGLSLLAFTIFIITLFIYILLNTFFIPYNLDSLDQLIYYSLQTLRSPPFDTFMLWLSHITSSTFIAILYLSWGSLLIYRRSFSTLWHWLAAISLSLLLSPLLINDLTRTLQTNSDLNIQSLPSIVIISVIGFSTVIINSGLSFRRQKLFYYLSATLVLFISLAQLYFALQVFSQVLFALFIGTLWFSLLGIAYRRHTNEIPANKVRKEFILILLFILVYPTLKIVNQPELHSPSKNYFVMGRDSWLESGWSLLPVSREGIHNTENNQFNLQWLGTKDSISSQLIRSGFTQSIHSQKLLPNWFLKDVKINNLPVLPHIHKGEYETLRFYQYNKNNNLLTVVRLWPSNYQLKQDSPLLPLWFGSVSSMEIRQRLGLKYLVTTEEVLNDLNIVFQDEKILVTSKSINNENKNKKRNLFLLQ